ncbi:endonuclease/exonuclease/phosphatase family protein [Enterococcus alishanensis]|uniref:endonuclease/exonuclease/phosphatase family protein n=1 Tax=Enterococcus alishanensis TaxID=1303817 RepID=UPI0031B7FC2A
MREINFLTFNTHSWLENNDQQQVEVLAQKILKEDISIIALQEVNQKTTSKEIQVDHYFQLNNEQQSIHEDNFAYCVVNRLRDLGTNYYWSWAFNHIGYDKYHEGVAILSKTPFQAEVIKISLEDDPADYHTRKALLGKSESLCFLSGHFSWWSQSSGFAYEWRKVEGRLWDEKLPLIIMGDFNNPANQRDQGRDLVLASQLNLQDSFEVATEKVGEGTIPGGIDGWKKNAQSLRIDYIFLAQEFLVEKYQIVFDNISDLQISDHYGVLIKTSLK